jgi:hypothetical protein
VDTLATVTQYTIYLLEAGVLGYLLLRRRERSLLPVALYLALLLVVDGLSRPLVLYRYGLTSLQYEYFFWLTDILLALGAFLLVCLFFRRACGEHRELWQVVRLVQIFVLILVAGISLFSLSRNFDHLFTRFIVEFQQNLYFTCLVLNTLLFILMQQLQSADEELSMLVCGMGIQFAGPAANLALVYLTPGQQFGSELYRHIGPLFTLGMLLTWFYALARAPQFGRVAKPQTTAAELVSAGRGEA